MEFLSMWKQLRPSPVYMLTLFIVASVLSISACRSSSLGTFKGLLEPLFPGQIGKYAKDTGNASVPEYMSKREDLGFIEYKNFVYLSVPDRIGVNVTAFNYASPEQATKALSLAKAEGLKQGKIADAGEKKKGWSTVGERFVGTNDGIFGTVYKICWTNGSVLFCAFETAENSSAVNEIEDKFPY